MVAARRARRTLLLLLLASAPLLPGACLDPRHGTVGAVASAEVAALGDAALGADADVAEVGALEDAALARDADVAEVAPPDVAAAPPADDAIRAVTATLGGLRWELPCLEVAFDDVCTTYDAIHVDTPLTGAPGERYTVRARMRGVVEETEYVGGTHEGHLQHGGTPVPDDWNTYRLHVSSPADTWYLNRGTTGLYRSVPVDFELTFAVDAGAVVSFDGLVYDAQQIMNVDASGQAIAVAGVPPWPDTFDGQFLQLDVLSVTR